MATFPTLTKWCVSRLANVTDYERYLWPILVKIKSRDILVKLENNFSAFQVRIQKNSPTRGIILKDALESNFTN